MAELTCISQTQITLAAERLHGQAVITPILSHPSLDRAAGRKVVLKLENLQRTGSFKFRGAYNKLCALQGEAKKPVVAWSSGNHAQGVACAAQLRGQPAHIVMPADAPEVKKRNTRNYGAQIIEYNRSRESREDIGQALATSLQADIVAPYDDYEIMAGQATCGMELIEQCASARFSLDAVLTCCGGGGLTAGVASALHAWSPQTHVYAVEPADFDDHARSLTAGQRLHNPTGRHSICDALLAPTPGALTFPINRELLSGVLRVTDEEVTAAIRFAYEHLKLVIEPGGAVALAAILHQKLPAQYNSVGIIVTGGNIDVEQFTQLIATN